MLLAAYEQWGHLDPHWNVNGDSIAIVSLSVSYSHDLSRTGLEHRDEQTRSGRGKTTSLEWEKFVVYLCMNSFLLQENYILAACELLASYISA